MKCCRMQNREKARLPAPALDSPDPREPSDLRREPGGEKYAAEPGKAGADDAGTLTREDVKQDIYQ